MLALAHLGGRAGGALYWIGPLLFLLLIGVLIYLFTRSARRHGPWTAHRSSGLAVLEERYANGEIDRDEFLAKRDDLIPSKKTKTKE